MYTNTISVYSYSESYTTDPNAPLIFGRGYLPTKYDQTSSDSGSLGNRKYIPVQQLPKRVDSCRGLKPNEPKFQNWELEVKTKKFTRTKEIQDEKLKTDITIYFLGNKLGEGGRGV
jgi:hypothetical protein